MSYAMSDVAKVAAALCKHPRAVSRVATGSLAKSLSSEGGMYLPPFCKALNQLLLPQGLTVAIAVHPVLRELLRIPCTCSMLAVGSLNGKLAGTSSKLGLSADWRNTSFLKVLPDGVRYAGTLQHSVVSAWAQRQRYC